MNMSKQQVTAKMDWALPETESLTTSPLKRRGWLLGLGAAGAAAVVAKVLPVAEAEAPLVAAADLAAPPDTTGGYQLSEHVLRYYETARS